MTLTLILGTSSITEGIAKTATAIALRSLKRWVMLDGTGGILLGVTILVLLPGASLWLLGSLSGIKLTIAGWDLPVSSRLLKKG